jgi:hypothetical protein
MTGGDGTLTATYHPSHHHSLHRRPSPAPRPLDSDPCLPITDTRLRRGILAASILATHLPILFINQS